MKADDPAVLDVMRRSMVARIATLSRNGRPSINPLYFVYLNGHIWLGTVDWTLAAHNIKADPRVSVLFEVEQDPSDRRVLRIRGRASVRTDRKAQRSYNLRAAWKYPPFARRHPQRPGTHASAPGHAHLSRPGCGKRPALRHRGHS
jgi:nitroimidazol reductase NimA-like FMN-containing flavoprotein (pyridoxamine 5'-phosphate oxidase superfamily)